jgi:hypothetical protein
LPCDIGAAGYLGSILERIDRPIVLRPLLRRGGGHQGGQRRVTARGDIEQFLPGVLDD